MLTRSQARAIARQRAAESVVVSPSATGQGTHTRWKYPDALHPRRYPLDRKIDYTATCLAFSSSSSDSSSGEDEHEDSSPLTSDSSFEAPNPAPMTPSRDNKPLTTPPTLSPKKLQRSPGRCRWTRIILSEESAEEAMLRNIQTEARLKLIANREYNILLRECKRAGGGIDMDMDADTEASVSRQYQPTEIDTEDGQAMDDGEPLEEMAGPSITVRAKLGPEGTELVDPVTFLSYSMSSNIDSWRQHL